MVEVRPTFSFDLHDLRAIGCVYCKCVSKRPNLLRECECNLLRAVELLIGRGTKGRLK